MGLLQELSHQECSRQVCTHIMAAKVEPESDSTVTEVPGAERLQRQHRREMYPFLPSDTGTRACPCSRPCSGSVFFTHRGGSHKPPASIQHVERNFCWDLATNKGRPYLCRKWVFSCLPVAVSKAHLRGEVLNLHSSPLCLCSRDEQSPSQQRATSP